MVCPFHADLKVYRSPETQMDRDMRNIEEKGFLNFKTEVEASTLFRNILDGYFAPEFGNVFRKQSRLQYFPCRSN